MAFKLIKPSKIKELALATADAKRAKEFKRVGRSFYEAAEAATNAWVQARVMAHPSKGVTLT